MFQKISRDIPADELTCINFSKTEISESEFKEKDEVEYNGSMYDVVKKEESGKYYTFYCVSDIKESQLIKNFRQHFDENKARTNQNNAKILIPQIAPAVMKNSLTFKRIDIISSLNNHFSFNYKSICLNKLTPPPRV